MSDRRLDRILNEIGRERYDPDSELVWRTKVRLHRSHMLPVAVFLSIGVQSLTAIGILLRAAAFGFAGGIQLGFWMSVVAASMSIAMILTARRYIGPRLRQLEVTRVIG